MKKIGLYALFVTTLVFFDASVNTQGVLFPKAEAKAYKTCNYLICTNQGTCYNWLFGAVCSYPCIYLDNKYTYCSYYDVARCSQSSCFPEME